MSRSSHSSGTVAFARRALFLLFFGWIAVGHASANAWGGQGHRIVGLIAQDLLGPKTKMAVNAITGGASLADESLWMDDVRATPQGQAMARWHYVNRPVCRPVGTSFAEECRGGACAPTRLAAAIRQLAKAGATEGGRTALRIVVHLVGDVHQPLHAADNNDRGGNDTIIGNRRCSSDHGCSLHAYWDSALPKAVLRGTSEEQFAKSLVRSVQPESSLDPAAWARESNELAERYAYGYRGFVCGQPAKVHLSAQYDEAAQAVVTTQLQRAGERLAWTLNAIFERQSSTH